ncbi:pyridine nucleotide-disulfide oxidoreductase [Rhodoblastus sphagnicola]|uniref:Pyridine nucleotide-disulfide oxidoreductase n=1 Tax=Rhodoblastus sphagnicola TaxID=333368 RepID=A0A2S6N4R6_9HYPH|nr:FAD-dependent oxidoreductase [Rhodoblastus sphagnicola]MBB4199617.1 3-phenylpropionate/trans-cinnamate dioxygenase ferredoxin reductase subunit [Rhodoblastus sphagnicola]PPQ29623.1 pyridine nucleotide-disulfide oxidoreductase [Rhodoblastus sphagnicola]
MGERIIIIGAGQAGLQIAESLRAEKFEGEILLLGEERVAPYQRPPLSKAWLAGETATDKLTLRGPEFFVTKAIDLRLGAHVTEVNLAAREITLADGETLDWTGLAFATGASARRPNLEGADLPGVCVLRGLKDAREISARLAAAKRIVVVGGGFIGLEVAAAARKKGVEALVLEAQDRLMARAVTPKISDFFADLHRARGVDIHFGAQVAALEGSDAVSAVALADGGGFDADLVVFGIGASANDAIAARAGLACDRGVIVDSCARTSAPNVVAAGDCTVFHANGAAIRLESVQNAVEQGKAAASALLGREKPFVATPWFWSDQYDVKLQMAVSGAGVDLQVARPSGENAFSLFNYRGEKLISVESVNRPGEHLLARKLLDAGLSPAPDAAADPTHDLKSLLR